MNIDKLNNSQLILLVMLVTIIISSAVTVGIIAILPDRLATNNTVERQTEVLKTVNNIIERKVEIPVEVTKEVEVPALVVTEEAEEDISITELKKLFFPLKLRGRIVSSAIFVSSDGRLLVPETLHNGLTYTIDYQEKEVSYIVEDEQNGYTIISPLAELTVDYLDIATIEEIELGEDVIIYGGFGDTANLFNEIISRVVGDDQNNLEVNTSLSSSFVFLPSVAISNNKIIGFLKNREYVIKHPDFYILKPNPSVEN